MKKKLVCGSFRSSSLAAGLKFMGDFEGLNLVALTTDLAEIPLLVMKHRPDVVVLDACDDISNIDGVYPPGFQDEYSRTKTVVLFRELSDKAYLQAYDFGADAVIARTQELKTIELVLHMLQGDSRFFSKADVALVRERYSVSVEGRFYALDDCDREILNLLANGHSDKEIASTVFLAHQTVRNRVSRLLKEFECRNRVELAVLLHTHGVVDGRCAYVADNDRSSANRSRWISEARWWLDDMVSRSPDPRVA